VTGDGGGSFGECVDFMGDIKFFGVSPIKALWPRMNTNEHESERILEAIVGASYEVSNVLGAGFLEKVYERALRRELVLRGFRVDSQVCFPVLYKGERAGDYLADLVVERRVIVELKCVARFCDEHMAQCINYLRASGLRFCLMVNFQNPRVEWKRLVLG
jgi:GxxExxY protein